MLHAGKPGTAGRVQAWALNRYYYQNQIPSKDAVMISRLVDWRVAPESGDGG